jgi:methyl-accepting chemotaxis protein
LFLFITLIAFLLLGMSALSTLSTVQVGGPLYNDVVQGKDLIADILPPPAYMIEMRLVELQMSTETDPAQLQTLIKRTAVLQSEFNTRHDVWVETLPDDLEAKKKLAEARAVADAFFQTRDTIEIPAFTAGKADDVRDITLGIQKDRFAEHTALINEVVALTIERNAKTEADAAAIINAGRTRLITIAIVAIFLISLIGFILMQSIVRPMKQLEDVTRTVASGDVSVTADAELLAQAGELGNLGKSFSEMTTNLHHLVTNIRSTVHTSSNSAEELSASAEEVSASIEQVSSTVQEIAKGAQTLSKSVSDVALQSKQAGESALLGSKSAQAVKQKMNAISESTQAGASQIKALGEKSKRIGDIVQTINGISEQTNLLALNAAIEAARAGDAGRGFAVVADEVRKLAEESKKATATITELIGTIQGEINTSVQTMEHNSTQVGESMTTISSAIETFEDIPIIVDQLNKAIAMISSIAEENAAGAEEVSASIEQVTSAMTQVASAAQQLSTSSSQLQQMVNKFKTEK